MIKRILVCLTVALMLAGCSASIEDYSAETPALKLEDFFSGNLVAHGMIQDRSGKVTRRFRADLIGTWNGNEGVLDETFYWDDGEVQKRVWNLTKVSENRYNGTAGDVVGVAEGTTAGNALHWVYQLEVPFNDGILEITLDDWMYLLDEDRLINKTEMRKFGFKVGELTLYIERIE